MTRPDILRSFARNDDGGITVLSLFLFLIMLIGAGFALDVNNAIQSRNQLQNAADNAGHAALYWRGYESETSSIAKAIELAELNMPQTIFGTVVTSTDVEFGVWNGATRQFTAVPGSNTSVRVTTRRTRSGGNGVGTFLLKFVGYSALDLSTVSIWDATPAGFCPGATMDTAGEGFFALGRIEIQSGNNYQDGFCIHSEDYVKFSSNSTFEEGVVVSMPDEGNIQIPSSGLNSNVGLEEALESQWQNLYAFFETLGSSMAEYESPIFADQLDHVTNMTVEDLGQHSTLDMATLSGLEGSIVNVDCGSNGTIKINEMLHGVTLVTDCKVSFAQNAGLVDGMLLSYNTDADKAVTAAAGVTIGDDTYCTNGGNGGAHIMTLGGIQAPSGFRAFGANLIAKGNVQIAADAGGLGGINIMSGGNIDATSGGEMGFCIEGPRDLFSERNIKMVM